MKLLFSDGFDFHSKASKIVIKLTSETATFNFIKMCDKLPRKIVKKLAIKNSVPLDGLKKRWGEQSRDIGLEASLINKFDSTKTEIEGSVLITN